MDDLRGKIGILIGGWTENAYAGGRFSFPESLECADEVFYAINAAGYQIVPRNPTERMVRGGQSLLDAAYEGLEATDIYRRMLAEGERE